MIEVNTVVPGVSLVVFEDEPLVYCRVDGEARYYHKTVERLLANIKRTLGELDPHSAILAVNQDCVYYKFRKPRGLFVKPTEINAYVATICYKCLMQNPTHTHCDHRRGYSF